MSAARSCDECGRLFDNGFFDDGCCRGCTGGRRASRGVVRIEYQWDRLPIEDLIRDASDEDAARRLSKSGRLNVSADTVRRRRETGLDWQEADHWAREWGRTAPEVWGYERWVGAEGPNPVLEAELIERGVLARRRKRGQIEVFRASEHRVEMTVIYPDPEEADWWQAVHSSLVAAGLIHAFNDGPLEILGWNDHGTVIGRWWDNAEPEFCVVVADTESHPRP